MDGERGEEAGKVVVGDRKYSEFVGVTTSYRKSPKSECVLSWKQSFRRGAGIYGSCVYIVLLPILLLA